MKRQQYNGSKQKFLLLLFVVDLCWHLTSVLGLSRQRNQWNRLRMWEKNFLKFAITQSIVSNNSVVCSASSCFPSQRSTVSIHREFSCRILAGKQKKFPNEAIVTRTWKTEPEKCFSKSSLQNACFSQFKTISLESDLCSFYKSKILVNRNTMEQNKTF